MDVFFFGMGFSSLAAARAIHDIIDADIPIAGTTRSEEGLEALAESVSGEELDGFFAAWLREGKVPPATVANGLQNVTCG